jgi:hypothetical protein
MIFVIIKHALVREFNDTLVQYDDIKPCDMERNLPNNG